MSPEPWRNLTAYTRGWYISYEVTNETVKTWIHVFSFSQFQAHVLIMVLLLNNTATQVTEFLMICFPGMQDTQHWLSVVLAPLLILALGANFVLLLTIQQETSLHEPMYYLLAILSMLDIILCLTVIPKVRPQPPDSLLGTVIVL